MRFVRTSFDAALEAELLADGAIAALGSLERAQARLLSAPLAERCTAVLHRIAAVGRRPMVTYRRAGDKYVLIEYGEPVLDLRMRFRVHALMEHFKRTPVEGIRELSPGVRSVQVHFDGRVIGLESLLSALIAAELLLPAAEDMVVSTRVVKMPLAFDASTTKAAIDKYQQSVRTTAPWLPSNIEFMRRINGLDSEQQVRDSIYQASYFVLGLGDVYLGTPSPPALDDRSF